MSLNADYTKIKDFESVCYVKDGDGNLQTNPITECLVFQAMATGLTGITEKNIPEWRFRLAALSKVYGPPLVGPDGPVDVTYEDLRQHIGLRTNVTEEKRKAFLRRLAEGLEYQVEEELRREAMRKLPPLGGKKDEG